MVRFSLYGGHVEATEADREPTKLITRDHRPHAAGGVGGAPADGVGDFENCGVAVVELVVEPASMQAIGEAAVADVVEGAVFAELNGIDARAGGNARAGAGAEGRPIVARDVSAVRKFGEENCASGIFDDGFLEAARFPFRNLAGCNAAILEVNAGAVRWVGKRFSARRNNKVWTGPIHGVSAAAAVRRPIDALSILSAGHLRIFGMLPGPESPPEIPRTRSASGAVPPMLR